MITHDAVQEMLNDAKTNLSTGSTVAQTDFYKMLKSQ